MTDYAVTPPGKLLFTSAIISSNLSDRNTTILRMDVLDGLQRISLQNSYTILMLKFKPPPRLHLNPLCAQGRVIVIIGVDLVVDAQLRLRHNQLLLGVCKHHSLCIIVKKNSN